MSTTRKEMKSIVAGSERSVVLCLFWGNLLLKKWDHMRNGGTFFWDSVSSRTMSKKTFTQNGEQSGLQNHVVAAGAVVVRGVL